MYSLQSSIYFTNDWGAPNYWAGPDVILLCGGAAVSLLFLQLLKISEGKGLPTGSQSRVQTAGV